MDNMSELYAMLFAYGVMFTVIGFCFSSDASAYGLVPTCGVEAWNHHPFYGRSCNTLTFGEPNEWWFLMIPYVNVAYALI